MSSFLATAVAAAIALGLGTAVALFGYRLFLILLPIWGFLLGIALGAHSVQALFGDGFLSTATSWVVGFFVGLLFALLSYFFWYAVVLIAAGELGYAIAVGFLGAIGLDLNVLTWVIGVAVGIGFAIGAMVLNLQKAIVIVATALTGAAAVVATFLFLLGDLSAADTATDPFGTALDSNPLWALVFLFLAGLGIAIQWQTTRHYEIERYNRWDEMTSAPPAPPPAA
jgi:hypothetical protein